MRTTSTFSILSLLLLGTACSDGTGPTGSGTASLSLSLATSAMPSGSAASTTAGAETFTLGATTIEFTSVQVVLKSVKLVRASSDDCESGDDEPSDDSCEALRLGPQLFDVPLTAGAQRILTVDVPADTYRRLKFHVHKPENDGNTVDQAFLAANPSFEKVSIRAEGMFNGTPFTFETDLNAVQQITFNPFLVVDAGGPVDLTMFLDLGAWFQDPSGTAFVNPLSALKGGQNENLVEQNIKSTIRVFRDDDQDGDDDEGDDDNS